MSNQVSLGMRIKRSIVESPYTGKEIAKKIGIAPSNLSKAIKKDSMAEIQLIKIAEITGADKDWLISGAEKVETEVNSDLLTKCINCIRKVTTEMSMKLDENEIIAAAVDLYNRCKQ